MYIGASFVTTLNVEGGLFTLDPAERNNMAAFEARLLMDELHWVHIDRDSKPSFAFVKHVLNVLNVLFPIE